MACPGGTSVSVGLWAGLAALINQAGPTGANTPTGWRLGFANPTLYLKAATTGQYGTNFHDVNDPGSASFPNNNNNGAGFGYTNGLGYDLTSGLGTPNAGLINATLPVQSCQPGSSLTVVVNQVTGDVEAYVPNGSWSETAPGAFGVQIVQLEHSGNTPLNTAAPITLGGGVVGTIGAVNTCAGDSSAAGATTTGNVVCTANTGDIYLIQGTQVVGIIDDSGPANGTESFSGGECALCNVAIDPAAKQAYLSIGTTAGAALQTLDLNRAFAMPLSASGALSSMSYLLTDPTLPSSDWVSSEALSVDTVRSVVLSPNENNNYQVINFNSPTPVVYNNDITPASLPAFTGGIFDAAAEDCTTGIALASVEGGNQLVLVDLTLSTFLSPANTWSSTGMNAISFDPNPYMDDVGGIATTSTSAHLAIVAGEFGDPGFAVVALPTAPGNAVPTPGDWVVAGIPNTPIDGLPWQMGRDPHTIGVYTSPKDGKAYGVFQDDANGMSLGTGTTRSWIAIVDLAAMLDQPTISRSSAHIANPIPVSQTCTGWPATAGCVIRFVHN